MWFTGYSTDPVGKVGVGPIGPPDSDGDGVTDTVDNCPSVANANQANADGDSLGDTCDPDANGDGIADTLQPSGTPAGSFVDNTTTPPTTGSIVNTAGLTVTITDAPDAIDGVLVTVGPGTSSPVITVTTAIVSVENFQCGLASTTDDIEQTAAGASGLQNLGGGNYQLNWASNTAWADRAR